MANFVCHFDIKSYIFFQKPGGIIALLDEPWYVLIASLVLVNTSSFLYLSISNNGIPVYPYTYASENIGKWTLANLTLFAWFSMFPRSTHETFAQKLYQTLKNNKRFIKPKLSCTNFTICHYAGEVIIHLMICLSTFIWICFGFHLYIYTIHPGNISSRLLLRQKQRLCCGRTSGFTKCFQVPICFGFISTTSWRDIKVFKVLFHWLLL